MHDKSTAKRNIFFKTMKTMFVSVNGQSLLMFTSCVFQEVVCLMLIMFITQEFNLLHEHRHDRALHGGKIFMDIL